MLPLIVVDNPKKWPLKNPGALLVSARSYLTDHYFSQLRNAKVFNLCRSYRYQSMGYYVSLLAQARGHKPLPSITAIQDMKSLEIIRLASDELEDLMQRSLRPLQSDEFELSVYFGQNMAKRYSALSTHLFRTFQTPLLRADFARSADGWRLRSVRPLAANDVPEAHADFVLGAAREFFAANRHPTRRRSQTAYDLAILHDPNDATPPSNAGALKRLVAAAKRHRIEAEVIDREDFGRLAEFDALFIRDTTAVNHYTYRFARRAFAEGLVVIDDPESITKCTNKVYLAELLEHHRIPRPRTVIVHRDNRDWVGPQIGLPCVLKKPDSSFSLGVVKADDDDALQTAIDRLLDESDLVIAQEFMPTEFDWRVTVLDRMPLFVCKYHMAPAHWQIVRREGGKAVSHGSVEAVALEQVPPDVLQTALRATRLIGDGLYGVDLKETAGKVFVIEVNDNPNIDAGFEDQLLKDELYDRIMQVFLHRIRRRKHDREKASQ